MARNGLVIFQFTMSVILIVSVVIMYKQLQFVQKKELGFKRENVVVFPVEGEIADRMETFLANVKNLPGVRNASYMDGDLVGLHGGTTAVDWEGKTVGNEVDFEILQVGAGLIETLGISIMDGRSFSPESGSEVDKIIFNKLAIERMRLANPVGKRIKLWGQEKEIIGIVDNFHFESLYEEMKPLFFVLSPDAKRNILVSIQSGGEAQTIAGLSDFYHQFNSGIPFEFRFLDQDFQNLYVAENRATILAGYFAALAILICCLGLFGLSIFTVERRVKEIGIRKVLGSTQLGIVVLLSGSLTKLVFCAIILALPLSYMASAQWLKNFAYRTELPLWYFAAAGLVALMIAWITVGLQALNAARLNPVNCLRDE